MPRVKRSTHPPVFWPGSLIPGAEHAKAARTPYRAVWSPGSPRDWARPALRHPEMAAMGSNVQGKENSLFRRKNSLFFRKNSLFRLAEGIACNTLKLQSNFPYCG